MSSILESCRDVIPAIFNQAQQSMANHYKNCVALHKLHIRLAGLFKRAKNGDLVAYEGETLFSEVFIDMASRILVIKKGIPAAERAVKFISAYVKFITEKDCGNSNDDDTPASRFVTGLLQWLVQGFVAKNQNVRFRTVNIVGELIAHVGELDEDIYISLRHALMERVHDKESKIRSLAIIALSKLVGAEDPAELRDDEPSIMDTLLECVCYDISADVRHAALLHIPVTARTLPQLLTRSRDVDPSVRKCLFTLLCPVPAARRSEPDIHPANTSGIHPRQLTLSQRERVVHDGLGDREDVVKSAANHMVCAWYDITHESIEGQNTMLTLAEFAKLFDIVGVESIDVAIDALNSLFITEPRILNAIAFNDRYWNPLTPESVFVARVFVDYCHDHDEVARLEAATLPVGIALAFYLQEACNKLLDVIDEVDEARLLSESSSEYISEEDPDLDIKEDAVLEHEFIVGELLHIVARNDQTDELGRRKMLAVVRKMLAHELLPQSLIDPCLDVLCVTAANERELIRIIVEIITELRDESEEDQWSQGDKSRSVDTTQSSMQSRLTGRYKNFVEMTPEERAKADAIDLQSLRICISMLSRVDGDFDDNSTLEGILADLIIPAVKRTDLALREQGLTSLGLCCLIAKNLAMSSFQLFINQVQTSPEDMKIKVLQVLFDLLMMYDEELLLRSADIAEKIIAFLLQTLEVETSQPIQAVLALGISKLMLRGLISDERVLTSLVLAYVSPATANNQELRQCLAYFLPVYCYSSAANQSRMQRIVITAYDMVRHVQDARNEDEKMITLDQFMMLLLDWTDPRKRINIATASESNQDVHIDLAIDTLKAMYGPDRTDGDRESLCRLLSELYVPDNPDDLSLLMLNALLTDLQKHPPFEDYASERVIRRFTSRFLQQFGRHIEEIDASDYVHNARFQELCGFLGLDIELPSDGTDESVLEADAEAQPRSQSTPWSRESSKRPDDLHDVFSIVSVPDVPSSPVSDQGEILDIGKRRTGSPATDSSLTKRLKVDHKRKRADNEKENEDVLGRVATPKSLYTPKTRSPDGPDLASPRKKMASLEISKTGRAFGDLFVDATNYRQGRD